MMSYWQLMELILPVFAIVAIGVALRRVQWLTAAADESLLKLVVNFLYPCLIFESVEGNPALRDPRNLLWAPLAGFLRSRWASEWRSMRDAHSAWCVARACGPLHFLSAFITTVTSRFRL